MTFEEFVQKLSAKFERQRAYRDFTVRELRESGDFDEATSRQITGWLRRLANQGRVERITRDRPLVRNPKDIEPYWVWVDKDT